MPFDSIYHMYWAFFRMGFKFFVESIFVYLIINNINGQDVCKESNALSKKKMLLFSSFYTSLVLAVAMLAFWIPAYAVFLFRLTSVSLVFFYSYYKQRKMNENLVSNYNNAQNLWYTLTVAIILVLAVESFNTISYILFHNFFVLVGIYKTVRSIDIAYQLYKTAVVFLDAFIMFLAYKLRFIRMKDIKNMSLHKRIPISFTFCLMSLISAANMDVIYDKIPSLALHRETLIWMVALILPSYIGFYLTAAKLTRLLSLRSNANADSSIHIWLFNPSMFNTTSLSVYDSNVFAASFESKKLAIKKRLDKLGINDESRGYSGLILCLFLTRLFMGLKGWSFRTDVFLQASLVIDVPVQKLHKDIENIINQIWVTSEAEDLINGYYFPYHNSKIYDQMERPTVEQFLTEIAKSI